eukprot:g35331.t1
MFEETEATKASGGGSDLRQHFYPGCRMKAASDLLQLIDDNVRIEEVEEDDGYDDIPLSRLVRVPESTVCRHHQCHVVASPGG